MSENTGLTIFFSVLVVAIGVMVMHGCAQCSETEREKIKAGLVQKPVPYNYFTVWSKP